jgi:hypothetical protein
MATVVVAAKALVEAGQAAITLYQRCVKARDFLKAALGKEGEGKLAQSVVDDLALFLNEAPGTVKAAKFEHLDLCLRLLEEVTTLSTTMTGLTSVVAHYEQHKEEAPATLLSRINNVTDALDHARALILADKKAPEPGGLTWFAKQVKSAIVGAARTGTPEPSFTSAISRISGLQGSSLFEVQTEVRSVW